MALIFLIFDVEVAFTYPVAVVFRRWVARGEGGFAFAELLCSSAILVLGLAYVWRRGDLEWMREPSGTTVGAEMEAIEPFERVVRAVAARGGVPLDAAGQGESTAAEPGERSMAGAAETPGRVGRDASLTLGPPSDGVMGALRDDPGCSSTSCRT